MSKLRVVIVLFSIIFLIDFADGQVAGRLTGSVIDPSGAAIPGAMVRVYVVNGQEPILNTKTNGAGLFSFPAVRPATYDVEVEAAGFAKARTRDVLVNPIQETGLPPFQLEVASSTQLVEVQANVQAVQLTNSEVSSTITARQVTSLPVLDRQVSSLFLTQAGVTSGRGPTVVNGLRTSFANVTLDGINIQDNFIRTNALDYIPTKTTIDQIAEVTVSTSNTGSSIGGGAAQMVLSTRSGSNDFHGAGYWYNRNSALSSNDWFNNKAGVGVPFLNLNQPGASLGGRILRDKLFFYANYEAYRLRAQSAVLNTVLTDAARNGVMTYRDTTGATQTANLLALRNIRVDPAVKALIDQTPRGNSTDAGDGLNTTGYLFNASSNESRNQLVYRGDYYLTTRHSFSGTYNYTSDKMDRPDLTTLSTFYTTKPPVSNDNHNHLLSLAWRGTVSATFTNEVRAGFNLGPGSFDVANEYPQYLATAGGATLVGGLFTNPVNTFLAQGRATDTYTIQDNANWIKGKHEFSFGYQSQYIRTAPYNDGGIIPNILLGISSRNTTGLAAGDLPGIRSSDLNIANNLYATLGGIYSSAAQTFNVTSRTSGFVKGATNLRHFTYDTFAGYFQDKWKVRPRLTLTLGLRYEYWSPLDEKDSLLLGPKLNGSVRQTLLDPNAAFDFIGKSAGRPFYSADANNLAPSFGFAYDVFGNGKTALRGSYSVAYVNDETITAVRADLLFNAGLSSGASQQGLVGTLSGGLPSVPTPVYKVPRTQVDNYALSAAAALALPDPNLRTPYVQQFTFGIQHEIKGAIVEVRYAGNHGTKLIRAFDYNQVVIRENGFLDDFKRARNNGFLSMAATGVFNPAYNGSVAGSQQLTVFPRLGSGGLLTNATNLSYIRQGEPGELAYTYQTIGLNGSVDFFRNPNSIASNTVANASNSTYNALQVELRKRLKTGLQVQVNYTYSKVLSDTAGDGQSRAEPLLDENNGKIERARAPFDLTHVFKGNYYYELPFGAGKKFQGNRIMNAVLGGWATSGIFTRYSGTPFSVFSNRGTLNRGAGRSVGANTATFAGNGSPFGIVGGATRMTGNGPYFVDASILGSDGRGVASDGVAPFAGQVLFNPGEGTLGALQRRMFSGPATFSFDASILKHVNIRERQSVEFRMDAYNFANHPAFWVGNEGLTNTARFNVNNTTFGKITGTLYASRVIQFGLYYRF